MKIKKTNISLNTKEMVEIWANLVANDKGQKKPLPRFTVEEFTFLTRLIFHKEYKYLVIEVADAVADLYSWAGPVLNGRDTRRLRFMQHFLLEGNATKAAIRAGYSLKGAKQQGYRTLKWIQVRMRKERKEEMNEED